MPTRRWIAFLSIWPGLPQIWSGQEVLGLILAGLFALGLNLAILGRFVWTEAYPPGLSTFCIALSGVTWFSALIYTCFWLWRCHPERHREEIDRLFRQAAEFYLQGGWNEARRLLEQILALDETDTDAMMQLGSIYLRTDQKTLARKAFRQCLEIESGQKWRWEISQALRAIGDR
jgi:hypothetical protein